MKIKSSAFFLLILSAFYYGCNNSKVEAPANGEGVITYKITYPENNPYNNVLDMLPRETILVFKNTKASFITSGYGIIQVVNLLDFENKKYTSLLLNSLGENLAYRETEAEIAEEENNPKYSFNETGEKKIIAGLECRKAIVTDHTNNKTFDIYYYDKVKVYLGTSPYKDFNYLLMEYPHTKFNLPMHLEATSADFSAVDTSLLTIQGNYRWVDRQEFMAAIKNIKIPL